MSDPDTIHRDLWRRGLLLTASEAGASAAFARVLRAQPNVLKLSEDRRRRLVVLGASEWSPDGSPSIAGGPADALHHLTDRRQRSAWVCRDVEQWGEIESSRALGLSKSAIAPLVEEARQRLRAVGLDPAAAAAALLEWSRTINPTRAIEQVHKDLRGATIRRRLLTLLQVLILFGAMAVIAWVGRDLLGVSERERAMRALQESLSNPMPDEASKKERHEDRSTPRPGGAP